MAACVAGRREASFDRCVAATALLPDAALLPPDRISASMRAKPSAKTGWCQQRWSPACARLAPLRAVRGAATKAIDCRLLASIFAGAAFFTALCSTELAPHGC